MSTRQVMRTSRPNEDEFMCGSDNELGKRSSYSPRASAALATFTMLLVGPVQLCLSRPLSQPTFPSPEDASRALLAPVQKHAVYRLR